MTKTLTGYCLGLTVVLASCVAGSAFSADKLVIISPHRKSIQEEFVPAFKKYYKAKFNTDVDIDWLDQGGTADDLRFLRSKYAKTPQSVGIDVFWGGGVATVIELQDDHFLQPFTLSPEVKKSVPNEVAGIRMIDPKQQWIATAVSSFGVFYNKPVFKFERLPDPAAWEDLADPKYYNQISATDPRRSGSAGSVNYIILTAYGWDKGWDMLTAIAANTRQFTQSSSDPIKAVVSGDAAAALAIDFYALGKINDLGEDKLGFVLPRGQTIIDPDPIALLKGAPNKKVAERFLEFVVDAQTQQILMLPKGVPGGPVYSFLGRMAANPKTYELTEGKRPYQMNPFQAKAYLKIDHDRAGRMKRILDDIYGTMLVDNHPLLKTVWGKMIRSKVTPEQLRALAKPPITEAEALEMTAKWDNDVFRNQTMNKWVAYAKTKYSSLYK